MPAEVKIEGLRELARALDLLPKNIGRNVLRGAVRAGAAVVRDETKQKAPVQSGVLKRSIYLKFIRELSDDMRQTFFVGVRKGKRQQKKSKAGTGSDAFYAAWVEYGHFSRPSSGGKFGKIGYKKANRDQFNNEKLADEVRAGSVRWIPAVPFMRPAWDAKKNAALEAITQYMMRRIPEEVRKL